MSFTICYWDIERSGQLTVVGILEVNVNLTEGYHLEMAMAWHL